MHNSRIIELLPNACEWTLDSSPCNNKLYKKCYCESHYNRAYQNVDTQLYEAQIDKEVGNYADCVDIPNICEEYETIEENISPVIEL